MGDTGLVEAGRDALPFELTPGQDHALGAILAGLQGPPPMMCLLQARARPCSNPTPARPLDHSYAMPALSQVSGTVLQGTQLRACVCSVWQGVAALTP